MRGHSSLTYSNPSVLRFACKAIASQNRVVSYSGRVFKNTITWRWKIVGNKLVYLLDLSLNMSCSLESVSVRIHLDSTINVFII